MFEFLSKTKKERRVLVAAVFINTAITLVAAGTLAVFIFANQAEVFDYFASRYLEDARARLDASSSEEGEMKRATLLNAESLVVDIVERSSPAVVSVIATKDVPVVEQYFENYSPFGNDPFFEPFQFQVPRFREKGTEEREVGSGSGFFVSADGLVITNRHVVVDAEASYTVLTNDGESLEAEVLAKDPFFDLALLRVPGSEFPHLALGDSDALKSGQTVIAIGNALGEFRNSVSVGVISGLARSVVAGDARGGSEVLEEVIQTDAAINPGNSGGPLLGLSGKVVGVNVAVVQGSENIGFALPSNFVKGVVSSVRTYGEIVRPFLGVRYVMVDERIREANNLSVGYGALVVRGDSSDQRAVFPGSPADKAGIEENDIILEIDGVRLTEERSLASVIRSKEAGDEVTLKILHKGEERTAHVTLKRAPQDL